jgi:SNF2 family DNA or RNA helicase
MDKSNYEYFPDQLHDSEFYKKIYHKKEYYVNRKKYIEHPDKIRESCDAPPEQFSLLSHQKLLRNYISPLTPYKNLLIFHGLGTGKTCTAIAIAENFKEHIKKIRATTNKKPFIYIISSSDAENNFKKELFGKCPPIPYVSTEEREKLNSLANMPEKEARALHDSLLKELESRITNPDKGGYYKFMGYRKFQNKTLGAKLRAEDKELVMVDGTIQRKVSKGYIENLDDSVLIIDEAHNIESNDYGKAIEYIIAKSKNLRVILLTATPMKNKPTEIVQFMNFILPKEKKIKTKRPF